MRARTVNSRDQIGASTIHWASAGGFNALVERLLEAGADANAVEFDGTTPIILASKYGHAETIKLLLENGATLNPTASMQPLCFASEWGHLAAVEALVDGGADVNQAESDGQTPLHWASAFGHADVVEFLVKKGAAVVVESSLGRTPMQLAARFNHDAVVKILGDSGAYGSDDV